MYRISFHLAQQLKKSEAHEMDFFLNINFAAPWTLLLGRPHHWPSPSYAICWFAHS
jgi:hypothetical protein